MEILRNAIARKCADNEEGITSLPEIARYMARYGRDREKTQRQLAILAARKEIALQVVGATLYIIPRNNNNLNNLQHE